MTRYEKIKVAFCALLSLAPLLCDGQESIERLLDKFSNSGSAEFSQIITRDPKTKQITKITKTLEIVGSIPRKQIEAAIKAEKPKADNFQEEKDPTEHSYRLAFSDKDKTSLYKISISPATLELQVLTVYRKSPK